MKYKLLLLLAAVIIFIHPIVYSQKNAHPEDTVIFNNYINSADASLPVNDLLVQTALYFRNAPYVSSTLEVNDVEKLVVNLREFDCTTFVESCMALVRAVKSGNPGYQDFNNELQAIRYRNGIIDGYTSRLHYVSDWIFENINRGIVHDCCKEAGGMQFTPNLSFMSSHPQLYPPLAHNKEEIKKMQNIEDEINSREHFCCYIPKDDIASKEKYIRSGDILFFTTSIEGLDTSHAGIAYWRNDVLTFIHASSFFGKVVIQPGTLVEYCMKNKSNTGIMLVSMEKTRNL